MKTKVLVLSCLMLACDRAPEETSEIAALQPSGPDRTVALAIAGNDCYANKVANAFLSGIWSDRTCGGGPRQRILFPSAPSRWQRKMSPVDFGVTDHGRFFRDQATLGMQGEDNDPRNGPESAHLVFYIGHGTETAWKAWQAEEVDLRKFSVGDDRTRYLWMLSCNVMAHGPSRLLPRSSSSERDNLEPQSFKAGSGHANVFNRWTENHGEGSAERLPLNRKLRLACGGSTKIGGGTANPMGAVWHYKRFAKLPVADSFILGLKHDYHVPLCITRGGENREDTPLYDQDFVRDEHPTPDGSHLYIQYPIRPVGSNSDVKSILAGKFAFAGASPSEPPQNQPPSMMPVLTLAATPFPAKLNSLPWASLPAQEYGFKGGAARLLFPAAPAAASELLPGWAGGSIQDDVCVRWQPNSGAVVLSWRSSKPEFQDQLLSPAGLTSLFTTLGLEISQWTAGRSVDSQVRPLMPGIEKLQMRIDSAPQDQVTDPLLQVANSPKCLYLRFRSWLKVHNQDVPVFGEGGEWLLAGCPRQIPANLSNEGPGGDVCDRRVPPALTFAWVGRQVTKSDELRAVLPLAEARQKANQQLRDMESFDAYTEVAHRWGYKAAPIHCSQSEMYLVYQFDYRARPGDQFQDFPPITIEVPAHDLGGGRIEDTWDCSPE